MIALRSINEIANINPLTGVNGHARATLTSFDLLTYKYEIVYGREFEGEDGEGNPLTVVQTMQKSRGQFDAPQVNALFQAAGTTIAPGDDFDAKMKQIVTFALLYQIEQDGRFGLTTNDWEVLQ